jgi:hypothetical protein
MPFLLHDSELEAVEEDECRQLSLIAVILIASIQQSTAARKLCRRYFIRTNLLPNPKLNTPWTHLYDSKSDRAFMTTMGVNTELFELILQAGFKTLWETRTIPRSDIQMTGKSRIARRSLDSCEALGLVLHYMKSIPTLPQYPGE